MDKLIASYFIAGCFALVSQFVHLTRMIVQPAYDLLRSMTLTHDIRILVDGYPKIKIVAYP